MAKAIPVVRSATEPSSSASVAATSTATVTANHSGQCAWLTRMSAPYAPTATYSAWPKESSPARPNSRS
jgi:hypothetical protein